MLIEFSVENFLSIKERITLSMLASNRKVDDEYPENISPTPYKNIKLLRSAAIYGANASGKTNVFKAFNFAIKLITTSHQKPLDKNGENMQMPFALDDKWLEKPTSFDFVFIHENIRYEYGFSMNSERILSEHLYSYPNNKKRLIFERGGKNGEEYIFKQAISEQKTLSKRTKQNSLYISTAAQWNFAEIAKPFEWFSKKLRIVIKHDFANMTIFTAYQVKELPDQKQNITEFFRNADFSINGLEINKKEASASNSANLEEAVPYSIKMIHKGIDLNGNEKKVRFDMGAESSGTKKFFDYFGPWMEAINNGAILIIDELDSHLHPELTKYLISIFHDPELNKNNAQLIFNTHDTNLLSADSFRRDQIWFTEKRNDGSTDLYSLLEFSPRKHENIEKGYLLGRYGAIPCIGELKF